MGTVPRQESVPNRSMQSADLENESDRVSPVYGRWFRPELVSANLWGNFAALVFCSSARETRFIVSK